MSKLDYKIEERLRAYQLAQDESRQADIVLRHRFIESCQWAINWLESKTEQTKNAEFLEVVEITTKLLSDYKLLTNKLGHFQELAEYNNAMYMSSRIDQNLLNTLMEQNLKLLQQKL